MSLTYVSVVHVRLNDWPFNVWKILIKYTSLCLCVNRRLEHLIYILLLQYKRKININLVVTLFPLRKWYENEFCIKNMWLIWQCGKKLLLLAKTNIHHQVIYFILLINVFFYHFIVWKVVYIHIHIQLK